MRARENNLYRFLSGGKTRFVIPVFQRNYDWKYEQCERLINDIRVICNTDKEHFIGTICYKETDRSELTIVDGQQRITSIMILLKALHDISQDSKLKEYIYNEILINKYTSNLDIKMKLKPIKKDESVYRKLIYQSSLNEKDFSNAEKLSNIYRNYIYFKMALQSLINEGYKDTQIKEAIEMLEIVELEIEDENPQVIFESLNSTGLDLTKADLIRNYVLMPLKYIDQEELYNKYWLPIEEIIGSSADVELFLSYYLIMKRKSDNMAIGNKKTIINNKSLYLAFKKHYSDIHNKSKQEIEELFKDIKKYASYYQRFIFTENVYPQNSLEQKFYTIFYIFDKKDAAILLMYILNEINEKRIDEKLLPDILDIIICYIFRSVVCKKTGLGKQTAALTIQRLDNSKSENYLNKLYSTLNTHKGSYAFPKNEEFQEALINNQLYISLKNKICKYLLYSIEFKLNPKECLPYENGTIEHVMPQNLNKEWKEYLNAKGELDKHELCLHTLGNLSLTGYNSELSNNSFKDKKEEYLKSNYTHTQNLARYNDWTSKEIFERGTELSKIALSIWKLPTEFNNSIRIDTGVTYDINSDFSILTGCKPNELELLGSTFKVSSWREMLITVLEQLYKLDKDIFDELVEKRPFKKGVLSKSQENEYWTVINDEYYIYRHFDTLRILEIIRESLIFFDRLGDTTLESETTFTLKSGYMPDKATVKITEDYEIIEDKTTEISENNENEIAIGTKVIHKSFGEGIVVDISNGSTSNTVSIFFNNNKLQNITKKFTYPDSFKNGFLTKL